MLRPGCGGFFMGMMFSLSERAPITGKVKHLRHIRLVETGKNVSNDIQHVGAYPAPVVAFIESLQTPVYLVSFSSDHGGSKKRSQRGARMPCALAAGVAKSLRHIAAGW
jgi:hypothetical protein